MFNKNTLILFFVLCFTNLVAQTKNKDWQIGFSTSVTKFSEEDAVFIGDQYQFQIPRINITMPLGDHLAIDGAITFQTIDFGFITNDANYFSMDASLRYFYRFTEAIYPYAFAGASIANTEFKASPTINIGAGANFWITELFGLNTQVYYKHSLASFEGMRSHIQVTVGMVFAIDLFDLFFNGTRKKAFAVLN